MDQTVQEQLGYSRDARLVIAHIDDLGMHEDETDGSVEVLRFGLARTGSVMVPAPGFAHFADIWKRTPNLDIGIHITLNSEWDGYRWPGILGKDATPSLYDEEGYLWKDQNLFLNSAKPDEISREIEAQIEAVLDEGFSPTHLDPHMYTAYHRQDAVEAMLRAAKKYRLVLPFAPPGRLHEFRGQGFVVADTFNGFYHIPGEEADPDLRRRAYMEWLENVPPGVHYLFLHPARVTDRLANRIRSPFIRQGDYEVWTSPEIRDLAEDLSIRFIGCRELQELQEALG